PRRKPGVVPDLGRIRTSPAESSNGAHKRFHLGGGLRNFAIRVRSGHGARAGVEPQTLVAIVQGTAQSQGPFAVAVFPLPAHEPGKEPAIEGLKLADLLERAGRWVAANSRGRV